VATGFRWDDAAQRYRRADGTFVRRRDVRDAVDHALSRSGNRTRALAGELRRGGLALEDWADAMRREIKRVHLHSAAAVKGGWAQLTSADFGRVGAAVRREYAYLDRLAQQVAAGLPLDGRFTLRVEQYAEAGRDTFHVLETEAFRSLGWDEERNILHPADHCDGCLGQTERGWVPLGTLVPIGRRQCRRNCRCSKAYRNTATGESVGE
jgi:hypothetical protein